ncbi:hypothetical protein M3640_22320, partial [Bacillus velezensis]|nr:hypothetical protein [Bacillus velezensis]
RLHGPEQQRARFRVESGQLGPVADQDARVAQQLEHSATDEGHRGRARRAVAAKRAQRYETLQYAVLANSPFIFMFEKVVQVATRPVATGPEIGPINDLVSYRTLAK